MQNLYLNDPYAMRLETVVAQAHRRDEGLLLELPQTIFRGAGGGQPADRWWIELEGVSHKIAGVARIEGRSALLIPTAVGAPVTGAPVALTIAPNRRLKLMACHTLIHVIMGVLRWITPGYQSRGAVIEEDEATCRLWFSAEGELDGAHTAHTEMYARSIVTGGRPVNLLKAKSPETAAASYPHYRVDPALGLAGRVRLVEIAGGLDCNPCSGTHVRDTAEIGPFEIRSLGWRADRACYELVARKLEAWSGWYGDRLLPPLPTAAAT